MNDSRRDPKELTEAQIAQVYRQLAEDHAADCAQAAAQRTWKRLEQKLEQRAQRSFGERVATFWREAFLREVGVRSLLTDLRQGLFARRSLAIGMLAGGLAIAGVLWLQRPGDLHYEVVGASLERGWLHSHETPVLLEFSDGSELQMRTDTSMSVSVVGRRSAITRLTQGELRVDVQHAERTDWRFFAGPFEVRVVGTKFDLTWRNDKLTVAMREGQVRIVGPEREWTVVAGERFEMTSQGALRGLAAHPESSVVVDPAAEVVAVNPEALPPVEANPNGTLPGHASRSSEEAVASRVSASGAARGTNGALTKATGKAAGLGQANPGARAAENARGNESWEQLLAKGEFALLLNEAKAGGVDAAIQSRSSGELAALAQAARYSKEAGLARRVWQGVRGRFAGSSAARDAAFFLGRVDEQAGQEASALELYRSYLREGGQNGAYAPEAMGRRLVLLRRSNQAAAAEEARRYLTRFPSGSYAKLAQDMVSSQK